MLYTMTLIQSLEKQLAEAQADLEALGSRRKGAEEEQEDLLEDLEELKAEREKIDVSGFSWGLSERAY